MLLAGYGYGFTFTTALSLCCHNLKGDKRHLPQSVSFPSHIPLFYLYYYYYYTTAEAEAYINVNNAKT